MVVAWHLVLTMQTTIWTSGGSLEQIEYFCGATDLIFYFEDFGNIFNTAINAHRQNIRYQNQYQIHVTQIKCSETQNASLSRIMNTVAQWCIPHTFHCLLSSWGSDCSSSAGSSKATVGKSKHNGGRDFRQHAYSQHHNMQFSPCCLYLSRSKITQASQVMVRNAEL